ncbi:MAG: hypothetical protein PHG63_01015 [Candidatus Dojkabacteria bacterium]|nr:hypothetical protein [Candidatus Dojkabacteria bacterium]
MKNKEKKKSAVHKKPAVQTKTKDQSFKRSVFYAVCLFVVFQVMLVPLQAHYYAVFWLSAVAGAGVVLSELVYARLSVKRAPPNFDGVQLQSVRWREHVLHHAVLPVLLYASGTLFLFFNRVRALDQVAVIILCVTFFAIFYTISATYLRLYQISRHTRVLFSFIDIIIFYFFTDVLMNIVVYEGLSKWLVLIGTSVLTFILLGMGIVASRQSSVRIALSLCASAVGLGIFVFLLWHVPMFNFAVLSLVATTAYYLLDAYWHHRIEGTFSWDVMSQYGLYAMMALILLLYL